MKMHLINCTGKGVILDGQMVEPGDRVFNMPDDIDMDYQIPARVRAGKVEVEQLPHHTPAMLNLSREICVMAEQYEADADDGIKCFVVVQRELLDNMYFVFHNRDEISITDTQSDNLRTALCRMAAPDHRGKWPVYDTDGNVIVKRVVQMFYPDE